MSCCAFAKLVDCEAEWELHGSHSAHVYEPLDVDAPADARPYCYLGDRITFYDSAGNRELARDVRHHSLTAVHPVLIRLSDGRWREVASGRVIYHRDRWVMRWLCYDNTRAARMANGGQPYFSAEPSEMAVLNSPP